MLIAPLAMKLGDWVSDQAQIDQSKQMAEAYRALAERLNIHFAVAGKWNVALAYDGVHFTEEGHRAFAEGLFKELTQ